MQKRYGLVLLTMLSLNLLLSSCQSTPQPLKSIDQITADEKDIKKVANAYVDQIFQSFQTRNYKLFKAHMTTDMQQQVNKQSFESTCKQFEEYQGKFISKTFLCVMNKGLFKMVLWKTKFDKNKNDVLTTMLIGKLDGKYQIFGIYFDK